MWGRGRRRRRGELPRRRRRRGGPRGPLIASASAGGAALSFRGGGGGSPRHSTRPHPPFSLLARYVFSLLLSARRVPSSAAQPSAWHTGDVCVRAPAREDDGAAKKTARLPSRARAASLAAPCGSAAADSRAGSLIQPEARTSRTRSRALARRDRGGREGQIQRPPLPPLSLSRPRALPLPAAPPLFSPPPSGLDRGLARRSDPGRSAVGRSKPARPAAGGGARGRLQPFLPRPLSFS
jgi:hypothetical protein